MFQTVQLAPPDSILGITEAFLKDTNPAKINLSVGVYKDAQGKTPVLEAVKQAERRLLDTEKTKSYLPIDGSRAYAANVQKLMFGADHEIVVNQRAATSHTPGGTGALRVAADYLKANHPNVTVWLSDPTWANHDAIFEAAGLPVKTYRYYDKASNGLDFDGMIASLERVSAGDVVLLHGCCHNPSGVDPSPEQWRQIAAVLAERGILPLVDFAYQGFGQGLREDAVGLSALCDALRELIICSSFSKNFGLYNERVGALTIVTDHAETTERVQSQVKVCIRRNYSNPPSHGGAVVTTILEDQDLRTQWEAELAEMRNRINGMRSLFRDTLKKKGITLPSGDNDFIITQLGMFSFSGLSKDQVMQLRDRYSIYIVGSGRINVAGMSESTMDLLCDAIGSVL